MVQGYCLKEKKKVEIKDPSFERNKLGRAVAIGKCPSCGGKIYKILKATETPANLKSPKKGGRSRSRSKSKKSNSKSRRSRKSKK